MRLDVRSSGSCSLACRAAHHAAGAVRGGSQRLGVALAAHDEAGRRHRAGMTPSTPVAGGRRALAVDDHLACRRASPSTRSCGGSRRRRARRPSAPARSCGGSARGWRPRSGPSGSSRAQYSWPASRVEVEPGEVRSSGGSSGCSCMRELRVVVGDLRARAARAGVREQREVPARLEAEVAACSSVERRRTRRSGCRARWCRAASAALSQHALGHGGDGPVLVHARRARAAVLNSAPVPNRVSRCERLARAGRAVASIVAAGHDRTRSASCGRRCRRRRRTG